MKKKNIQTVLKVYLRGEKIEARVMPISIGDLYFDEFNPRISMYRDSHVEPLGLESLSQDEVRFGLEASASFNDLKNSILDNQGAMNPAWVYEIKNNNYCVIEGNTRLAVYKELNEEHPDNPNFKAMNCYVLSQEIEEDVKDFIRLTAHLHGQTPWDSYERAKYLFVLYNNKRFPIEELMKRTKLKHKEIMEDIEAYKIMENEFSKVFSHRDGRYVHKFSYFKEYVKNKKLMGVMEEQKLDQGDFSKWVADNKLNEARDVRKLSDILNNTKSRESFLEKDYDRAHEILKEIIPEKSDKIYQTMADLTDRLKNLTISQLGNIDPHKREIIEELKKKLDDILRWGK
jgi:hypothetical protein